MHKWEYHVLHKWWMKKPEGKPSREECHEYPTADSLSQGKPLANIRALDCHSNALQGKI